MSSHALPWALSGLGDNFPVETGLRSLQQVLRQIYPVYRKLSWQIKHWIALLKSPIYQLQFLIIKRRLTDLFRS